MALNATPKSPTANSYLTEVEANTILTEEWLNADAWVAAVTAKREAALIMGTFLMEAAFIYEGSRTDITQALRLPRHSLVDQDGYTIDHNTVPKLAKKACAVFANYLLAANRLADPELVGLGISSASLGPISVTIDPGQVKSMIPKDVILIMEPIADLDPAASSGMRMVKLERG